MSIENIIRRDVLLKPLTTMKTGGPASYFAEPSNEEEIIELIKFANDNNLKTFILGNGSNVIADDDGFDGCIISCTWILDYFHMADIVRLDIFQFVQIGQFTIVEVD